MKINTREQTIVELPSTMGDVCFRERFSFMQKGRARQGERERKKQNMDNERSHTHTADHQI